MTIRETKDCFTHTRFLPSRGEETGDRGQVNIWTMKIGDVVDTDESVSWVSQELLDSCASVEPGSDLGCCRIGMTASVMGVRKQVIGPVRRLGSLCLWDHNQIAGETNHCTEELTSKNILYQHAHETLTSSKDVSAIVSLTFTTQDCAQ